MDNQDHKNTWNNFTKFVLWGSIAVVLVLILMANQLTALSKITVDMHHCDTILLSAKKLLNYVS